MTNERDFKSDLSNTQNLMLALGLSQKIIVVISQEFIENDLKAFESVVNSRSGMKEVSSYSSSYIPSIDFCYPKSNWLHV